MNVLKNVADYPMIIRGYVIQGQVPVFQDFMVHNHKIWDSCVQHAIVSEIKQTLV